MNKYILGAVAMIVLTGATGKPDTRLPSATITIDETQFGFLLGGNVGGGKLQFGDKFYPFKVGGISVGDIGVSHVRGYGQVFNLTRVADFAGTYTRVAASATFVSGSGALQLRNKHGVVIELDTTSKGLQLSAGAGGVKITMR
ncbi:hypothetical protein [Polymorphobacter megasporae]|uniref:hypothetical protein n=1 Tax=Glacieibacterium megasporae TaxID=2835787 RepID=UPI001C1E4948|nr:hypothetical protein [Polymorphobacter megasporae]UAJ10824.1 hypothetical protein KTC28_03585 [Polymorphobacter megasporae]